MREIQASEAKAHLPQLLDDVERAPFVRGRGNTVWWASGGMPTPAPAG